MGGTSTTTTTTTANLVEQIGVKNNDDTAKFSTVIEEVMKIKTGYRANYYRSLLFDPGGGLYGLLL